MEEAFAVHLVFLLRDGHARRPAAGVGAGAVGVCGGAARPHAVLTRLGRPENRGERGQ